MPVQTSDTGISDRLQAVLFAILFGGALLFAQSAAWGQVGPEQIFTDDQFADEVPRGETVRSRKRPEVDPVAIRLHSFMVSPALRQGMEFNDNIFATEDSTKSGFIYTIQPSVSVQSDWNNHRLFFDAGSDIGFFIKESSENYLDFYGRAGGRVDITSRNAVRLNAGARRGHEARTNPNAAEGVEPTVFDVFDGSVQYTHRFNRLSLAGGGTVERRDYEDATSAAGLAILNDDRDRTIYRPGMRLAYEIMPSYSAFVRSEGVFNQYDDLTDKEGFKRNSRGYDLVGGASIDITGLLFGEVFGGFRTRYFDDSRFDTVQGGVFGAAMTWVPTPLTTVNVRVDNQIVETISVDSSSFTSSGVSLDVDHELLRNLILSAGASFRFDDHEGTDQEDSNVGAHFAADYLMNRYVRLRAQYRHQLRDSTVTGNDFSQNSTMLFLTLTP